MTAKKKAAPKKAKQAASKKTAAKKTTAKPAVVETPPPVATVTPVLAAKPAKRPHRALIGIILLAVFALVIFESVSIIKTKKDQQRVFTPLGSFGMRGGDTSNRETYKGVIVLRIDSQDRLFLVDNTLGRVLVYDSQARKYLMTIDQQQAGYEKFRPVDVDGDADGNIYIVDQETQSVRKFDSSGQAIGDWKTESGDSICVEPEGTVLVTDKRRMQIVRYTADGTEVKKIGAKGKGNGKFLNVFRLDVDEKGNIYALDLAKAAVLVFNKKGKFQKQWVLKFKPDILSSIFVKNQKVYVNDFQEQIVWTYNTHGKLVWRIRAEWPIAPVMDNQDNYYLPNRDGIGYYLLEAF